MVDMASMVILWTIIAALCPAPLSKTFLTLMLAGYLWLPSAPPLRLHNAQSFLFLIKNVLILGAVTLPYVWWFDFDNWVLSGLYIATTTGIWTLWRMIYAGLPSQKPRALWIGSSTNTTRLSHVLKTYNIIGRIETQKLPYVARPFASIPCLGTWRQIRPVLHRLKRQSHMPKTLILEDHSLDSAAMERIFKFIKRAPSLALERSEDIEHPLRHFRALLGRSFPSFVNEDLRQFFRQKRVCITGCGTLGQSLARELSRFDLEHLGLVDHHAGTLHTLKQALQASSISQSFCLQDVRNKDGIDLIMRTLKPQIVFHTAGYNDLPLNTWIPSLLAYNEEGSFRVLQACDRYDVQTCIMPLCLRPDRHFERWLVHLASLSTRVRRALVSLGPVIETPGIGDRMSQAIYSLSPLSINPHPQAFLTCHEATYALMLSALSKITEPKLLTYTPSRLWTEKELMTHVAHMQGLRLDENFWVTQSLNPNPSGGKHINSFFQARTLSQRQISWDQAYHWCQRS